MREILIELIKNVRERAKSPLISSYIISFVLFNWKIFGILLFSEKIIEKKISFVEYFYLNKSSYLIPLLMALFYVVGIPYLNLVIRVMLEYYDKKSKKHTRVNVTDELRHKVEVAELEATIQERRNAKKELEQLRNEAESLRQENQMKNDEIVKIRDNHTKQINNIEEDYKYNTERLRTFEVNELNNRKLLDVGSLILDSPSTYILNIKDYLVEHLTRDEQQYLNNIVKSNHVIIPEKMNLSKVHFSLMLVANLIQFDNSFLSLTDAGISFIDNL